MQSIPTGQANFMKTHIYFEQNIFIGFLDIFELHIHNPELPQLVKDYLDADSSWLHLDRKHLQFCNTFLYRYTKILQDLFLQIHKSRSQRDLVEIGRLVAISTAYCYCHSEFFKSIKVFYSTQ